jgi:hypothetical protein
VTAHDEIIPNLVRIQGAGRQVDLHPTIATFLKEFVGKRTSGFLFCARQGKPVSPSNIIRRRLHKALKKLDYVNPFTGTHKAPRVRRGGL